MPLSFEMTKVNNNEWIDKQFGFTGQWLPALDAALIGPENFNVLRNLRYNDAGLEGVNGYTTVNTTALTNYDELRNGFHFRSDRTDVNSTGSYVLVQSRRTSDQRGRVYVNKTTIGSSGDFSTDPSFSIAGSEYDTDPADANDNGRFSAAPQNTCFYCNGNEVKTYSGQQHRIAAAFMAMDREGFTNKDISDIINNKANSTAFALAENLIANATMEADSNWSNYGTPTTNDRNALRVKSGKYSRRFIVDAANEGIECDAFTVVSGTTYRYGAWIYANNHANVGLRILDGDGTNAVAQTDNAITQDKWQYITGTFTSAASGSSAQVIFNSGTDTTGTWAVDDVSCCEDGYYTNMILLTTRPVRGFWFNIATPNTVNANMDIYNWTTSEWGNALSETDGTKVGSVTCAQDGSVTFSHTAGDSLFKYVNDLYLYAYNIELTAGKATFLNITCDPAFQDRTNVWDGVYRVPIEFQVAQAGTTYSDYTLHVQQASDTTVPIGGEIGDCDSGSHIIIMFNEKVSVLSFTMLGNLINTSNVTNTVNYWNGFEWTNLTLSSHSFFDRTEIGRAGFGGSGVMFWQSPTDEEKLSFFNSLGYAYKIEFDADLSGTNPEDIVIDLCYGIPALSDTLTPFDFSALFNRREMLGSYSRGDEGNRMDYCVTDAPDVWNGTDSSDGGYQSLYFGGQDKLTAATQLFNRFGASVFSMLLVFKATDIYMLVGDSPSDFQIFPVSQTIGCPAPLTVATAEVGLEIGEGLTRNIAIWISHSGPVMFDGAVLQPVKGIENYFDPNEPKYVDWDTMDRARGWVDQTYREYNLLIPAGPSTGEVNTWLCYDLQRKKWFEKHPGTAKLPWCGFNVVDTTGENLVYGGDNGGQMHILENGTTWGGIPITQKIRTGDFWPSDNIWDTSLIRKFKFYIVKTQESGVNLDVTYFADTAANSGNGIIWTDQAAGVSWADQTDGVSWSSAVGATLSLDLDTDIGLQRVTRVISDLNRVGWSHAFEFEVQTSSTDKGFQPISWGIRYRLERKDDTATG
jgi:hypothetical protein